MKVKDYCLLALMILLLLLTNIVSQNLFAQDQTKSEGMFFRDDFTGTSLRPEWSLRLPDPERWALIDNEYLLIITTARSKEGGIRNELVFTKNLPQNYEIMTKIIAAMENNNSVELKLQRDSKNYLTVTFTRNTIRFHKYLNGEKSGYEKTTGDISGGIHIRIIKQGIEYVAYYSVDETTNWVKIGSQIFQNLNGNPIIAAYNPSESAYNPGPEIGVKIDYFEIKKIK